MRRVLSGRGDFFLGVRDLWVCNDVCDESCICAESACMLKGLILISMIEGLMLQRLGEFLLET
jgi:hypothetical protein